MPGIDRPDGEPKPDRRPCRRGELTALVGELFDPPPAERRFSRVY